MRKKVNNVNKTTLSVFFGTKLKKFVLFKGKKKKKKKTSIKD